MSLASAGAQSLEDTLIQTYLDNPGLAAERAAVRATDEQVPQALSNWRPRVELSGSYGYRDADVEANGNGSVNQSTTPRSVEAHAA